MKKFGLAVILLLLISMFPLAMAEEVTTDQQTLSLTSSMTDKSGKEVRFLQLEKAITRNILVGKEVIKKIDAQGGDTSELEAIVTQLDALRLELKSLDPASPESLETFLNIRQETISLAKQFRETAKGLISPTDKAGIMQKVNADPEIKQFQEKIKKKVDLKNKQTTQQTLDALGIKDNELLAKIESGQITLDEVKAELQSKIDAMSADKKAAAASKLKEAGIKEDVAARAEVEKANLKAKDRDAIKAQWQEKAVENIKDPAKKAKIKDLLEKKELDKKKLDLKKNEEKPKR